jgi:myosin-5
VLGISSGYSGMVGWTNNKSMVEAKYPSVLFKQQLTTYIFIEQKKLTTYIQKIYGLIRDSSKKEIRAILTKASPCPITV